MSFLLVFTLLASSSYQFEATKVCLATIWALSSYQFHAYSFYPLERRLQLSVLALSSYQFNAMPPRGTLKRRLENALAQADEDEARAAEARLREAMREGDTMREGDVMREGDAMREGDSVREGRAAEGAGGRKTLRRRIESASAPSSSSTGPNPEVTLSASMRKHWATGRISSPIVQEFALGAVNQGASGGGLERLAAAGKAGTQPQHLQRALMSAFGQPKGVPQFRFVPLPAKKGNILHPVILPHDFFRFVSRTTGLLERTYPRPRGRGCDILAHAKGLTHGAGPSGVSCRGVISDFTYWIPR